MLRSEPSIEKADVKEIVGESGGKARTYGVIVRVLAVIGKGDIRYEYWMSNKD